MIKFKYKEQEYSSIYELRQANPYYIFPKCDATSCDKFGIEVVEYEDPKPTKEQLAKSVRSERDNRLNQTNWLVERHQEQLTLGSTTLSSEEYLTLLAYRQSLRDIPQQEGFPTDITWPEELPYEVDWGVNLLR